MFDEAFKATTDIEALDGKNKQLKERVLQLQSAIRYSNEDYSGAQSILLQRKASHENTLNDEGCLLYQVNILIFSIWKSPVKYHNPEAILWQKNTFRVKIS